MSKFPLKPNPPYIPDPYIIPAKDEINSSNNSNGWISVKERLPKEDECVLIYQPKAGCWVSSYDKHDWGMWENGLTCEPTHWMLLPEPPKDK